MKTSDPYIYTLTVNNRKIVKKQHNGIQVNFSKPVTEHKNKIYLLYKGKEIYYVGITVQSISSRLRYGINPVHSTGYHGYKWLEEDGEMNLAVWILDDNASIETIEAEIVFLIRAETDKWPKYQNEIHFHQSSKEERKIARMIFDKTLKMIQ